MEEKFKRPKNWSDHVLTEADYKALYPIVKGFVIKYECHGNPYEFDEDNFNDTAENCLRIMRGVWIGIPQEMLIRYFCKSYKINRLRKMKYARAMREVADSSLVIKHEKGVVNKNVISDLDCEVIKAEILKKFDLETEQLFRRYITDGHSIASLEAESGRKGLKYQFHKILLYLKDTDLIKELREYYAYGTDDDAEYDADNSDESFD